MIIARRPGCLDDVREKRGDEDGATERVARVCAARHRRGRQTIYCARGQAENLIKLHKAQLASDRTSCRSPLANPKRLILHTAAYWLILTVRDAIPKAHALATAEFATLRLRLLKLGTRVIETASRVRLAFAAACPEARLIRHIAAGLMPAAP